MSHEFLFLIIETIIIIGYLVLTRNSSPETITDITTKINLIIKYADAFVSWAKQFMDHKTGSEKMDAVVAQLRLIAIRYNIDMSEEEIKAIAQKAYDNMKAKENKSE